ncbi:CHAT domain-containing tetratricopeptide repeat protein [Sphingosinicella terrae]|uniref:CHAT domain-containing tetratricopeptide repeat protein n=1 Tax=Sphingosinicella terrae TaxID=2172047 RepID=UPI000E0D7FDE|nr:CHAT domain-containing protein [Sphingosinicella terrae]
MFTSDGAAARPLRRGRTGTWSIAAALFLVLPSTAGAQHGTDVATALHALEQQIEAARLSERAYGADDARTLSVQHDLARLYMNVRRFAEAEALLTRIVEVREQAPGPEHDETLGAMTDLGRTHLETGRLAESAVLLERVLSITERLKGADDPATLRATAHLAALRVREGRFAEAEILYARSAAGMGRALGAADVETISISEGLAGVYRSQGRLADAEDLYLRLAELRQQVGGPDDFDALKLLGQLADTLIDQRRISEAAPILDRIVGAGRRVLGPDHFYTLAWSESLAFTYAVQQRLEEAETLLEQALEARERTLPPTDWTRFTSARRLGEVYQRRGRIAEAEALYRRALSGYEAIFGPSSLAVLNIKEVLALLYERQGRFSEAEPLHAEILSGRLRHLGEAHPGTITSAAALAGARLTLPEKAETAIVPARLMVAGLRARRGMAPDTASGRAQSSREQSQAAQRYLLLADAAWWTSNAERDAGRRSPQLVSEVFTALQDAVNSEAGRTIVQSEARRLAAQVGTGLGALVLERQALDGQWARTMADYSAWLAAPDPGNEPLRRSAAAQGAALERRMDELDAQLRRDFPAYFSFVAPEAVDLAAVFGLLGSDEALVLVVPSAIGTHVVAVNDTTSHWAVSQLTAEDVTVRARALLWNMGAPLQVTPEQAGILDRLTANGYPREVAYELYRELLEPVNHVIGGKRHVFVVAAGALTGLPFGMLVTEPPIGSDGDPAALRATRWLADGYALVQLPSVQSLVALRASPALQRSGGSGTDFIGFGDPVLQGAPSDRTRSTARLIGGAGSPEAVSGPAMRGIGRGQLDRLARLPGTAIELELMRDALQAPASALFLAERATEANVRASDLSQARVIAFATHGLVAGQLAGADEPGLVLTPPVLPSEADDGYLAASEVAALRLNAEWVILSACNTAAGDGRAGAAGLSGLARAFFFAGARTLLASHWPVADAVAARLTVRTVELLRDHSALTRAEAFQRAMREVRNDVSVDRSGETLAHPFYWAPFALIGDGATR